MASVKAALTVTLKADDVVVAEVEDAALWQRVLTCINEGRSTLEPLDRKAEAGLNTLVNKLGENNGSSGNGGPIAQLAAQLDVSVPQLQGACSPSIEAPYLHLDSHCWEEMKKQLPNRGPSTVSAIVAAATLLGLWCQKVQLGNPTQAQAQAVLDTINVTDRNASRSIKNTSWLQGRQGGQIVLNPAEISKAIRLARCFCTKDWAAWKEPAK